MAVRWLVHPQMFTVGCIGRLPTVRIMFEQKPVPILNWTSTGFLIEITGVSSNLYLREFGLAGMKVLFLKYYAA